MIDIKKQRNRARLGGLLLCLFIVVIFMTGISPTASGDYSTYHPDGNTPAHTILIDTSYSFIQYDTNHLYIASDSTAIHRLFHQWQVIQHTGKGNLSIMHLGSSHVQGGTFPNAIRRNILLTYPNLVASRGMIFPYSAAKRCNNPYDYKVSRSRPLELTRCVYKEPTVPLGVCGIAVTASDSTATIGIKLCDEDIPFHTTRITLLGYAKAGVIPQLQCGDLRLVPSRIDSLHHRYYYNLATAIDSFSIVLPCQKGQSFTLTGVLLTNRQPGFTYHSIGVNGASLNDYLRCPDFTTDLQLIKPDLVIFGIGINDASGPNFDTAVFRASYQQLIDTIRSVNPECAFIFITNNDSYKRTRKSYIVNTNGPRARDVFYRLADNNGGTVWDQYLIMGGLKSMERWRRASLAQTDRVHFTRAGYTLLGNMFSQALFEALQYYDDTHPYDPMNQHISGQRH